MFSFLKGLFDRGRGIRPFQYKEVKPTAGIKRIREEIIEAIRGRANASRQFNSKYDAAQDTFMNENHWRWADELSPNSANTLAVRKKLRSRSRYEVSNNGYLKGIVLSKSQDVVGTGPRLQITDPRFSEEQKLVIEKAYEKHQKRSKLRRKLRQLTHAKMQDGEGFAVRIIDDQIQGPVKTTQKVIECDQFSHWTTPLKNDGSEIDGVRISKRTGEPTHYYMLKQHPGENLYFDSNPLDGQWIKRKEVIHWFRRDRPWHRGIPETIATLPLWALLRRYTLAVVQNAEIAADFTVLLQSMQGPAAVPFSSTGTPAQPYQSDPNNWFDSFPVDRGLMTVLPEGYDIKQLDPQQPVSAYDTFVNALIQEAARPLLVPRNMAIGNSGTYNMASGALDRQLYIATVRDERTDCGEEVLDQDFEQWWYEAVRVDNYFVDEVGGRGVTSVVRQYADLQQEPPDHMYRWDDIPEHHDPVKAAQAINVLHMSGHLSDKDIQEGRFNRRVEDHYSNLEDQEMRRSEIGIAGANPDHMAMLQAENELQTKDDDFDNEGGTQE